MSLWSCREAIVTACDSHVTVTDRQTDGLTATSTYYGHLAAGRRTNRVTVTVSDALQQANNTFFLSRTKRGT